MDKERILAKVDEIRGYVSEMKSIFSGDFAHYMDSVEKRRACERLLQISIESVVDICNILVSSLHIGLPADEGEVVDKLVAKRVLSEKVGEIVRNMKGFRNVLVHKYGVVEDELVYEMLSKRLEDFEIFIGDVMRFLKRKD